MDFPELARLASAHVEARILQVAVRLGVFDAIGGRSLDAPGIALSLGTDPRATTLLLNALAAMGLLEKSAGRFSLTPIATNHLLRSSAQYLGGMILFDAELWSCWGNLADAIRSGAPVRTPDMYQNDPSETEIFIGAMDSLVKARGDAEWVANAIDWGDTTEFLDVGSGPGTYPIAICERFAGLNATIFDLPATLRITQRYVRQRGMEDRVRLIAGDYRTDTIPGCYDVILLSNIIHGEGERANELLVRKLVSNLQPGGRFVVKDHILDESRASPPVGAVFSLLMLLTTVSGRCYSFDEIRLWMERANLSQVQKIDLPPPFTSSLVVGTK
jgi:SAM-dependent methyltransferase